MAFFATTTTRIAILLLSLSSALSAATATYDTIAKPPESPSFQLDDRAHDIHFLRTHITATANQVELFLSTVVPEMLKGPAAKKQCQPQCVAVCPHIYTDALDDLKKGLESLQKEDFYMLNVRLVAYITDIDTCDHCIIESEKVDDCLVEFRNFDAWAKKIGNELLARSIKY
ncbi:hypothetical protein ABFS82_12G157300 [Erythranthe guttata]